MNTEQCRLEDDKAGKADWRLWGPYLSEHQWGTVREDYSPYGTAWEYLTHDDARRRAYRWGEDGIAGFSDKEQRLCFCVGLWNGKDPILKERLFGLTNSQGNHGEDVKELYYYLDATPSHSYLKYLYKYPHAAYPYQWLIDENQRRGRDSPEFELLDTGLFDENRYFDVFVEYAKAGPDDVLIQINVWNRGPEEAVIHVLPQFWFRNTSSWSGRERPSMHADVNADLVADEYRLYSCDQPNWMFCENESNLRATWPDQEGYFKDAFHEYLVHGNHAAVNPAREGSKAAAHYARMIGPGESAEFRLRLRHGEREFPWFASWDLAFHTVTLAMIDPEFAKSQISLLVSERYMHPNGQLPAYEWAFGDTNPPVQAWAALRIHKANPDRPFLERLFHKLLLNFSWWVNKKDVSGRNIFQGGFPASTT